MVLTMPAPDRLHIQITDMGFGEIFPADGGIWDQDFQV